MFLPSSSKPRAAWGCLSFSQNPQNTNYIIFHFQRLVAHSQWAFSELVSISRVRFNLVSCPTQMHDKELYVPLLKISGHTNPLSGLCSVLHWDFTVCTQAKLEASHASSSQNSTRLWCVVSEAFCLENSKISRMSYLYRKYTPTIVWFLWNEVNELWCLQLTCSLITALHVGAASSCACASSSFFHLYTPHPLVNN